MNDQITDRCQQESQYLRSPIIVLDPKRRKKLQKRLDTEHGYRAYCDHDVEVERMHAVTVFTLSANSYPVKLSLRSKGNSFEQRDILVRTI